jgi:hypothetical protein
MSEEKPQEDSQKKPLLFISHKHSDSDIATAVAEVIKRRTLGAVRIFQSSNWKFDGPRYGGGLDAELRKVLWEADALILIYTSEDQNWQYCMYECGVATQSNSPDTSIVVFQCGRDVPSPFAADLRVDINNNDNLKGFTKQLLKSPKFFPRRGKALAPDADDDAVEKTAEELAEEVGKYISRIPPVEWSAWPFLRIRLPEEEVNKLAQAGAADRAKTAREVVEQHAVVVKSDHKTAALFGLQALSEEHKFADLLRAWRDNYPTADATWFDSCCEQIMVAARTQFPVIRQARLRKVGGLAEFTPVLSRVKNLAFGKNKSSTFDIFFYNLSDPRAVSVESRMIKMGDFFYKSLARVNPESLKLLDLLDELDAEELNRMPLFSAENHPLYIVHRSMIDKFIVRSIKARQNPADLTLSDLLADAEMKRIFEETFVVVKRQASLAEARDAMAARPNCSDVFVTEGGGRDEPVVGWLTNVDLVRSQ